MDRISSDQQRLGRWLVSVLAAFAFLLIVIPLFQLVGLLALVLVLQLFGLIEKLPSLQLFENPATLLDWWSRNIETLPDILFLPSFLTLVAMSFFLGYRLWHLLFVKSGYLDKATVEKMEMGLAPTVGAERIRKAIGFSLFLPASAWLAYAALTEDIDWWLIPPAVAPIFYFGYLAWKEYSPPSHKPPGGER